MEMQERKSGLVVPKEKREPPPRRYGPTEIQEEERRVLAKQAMLLLWDAMGLANPGGTVLSGTAVPELREAYYRLYCFVGEFILGEDCPEGDELT